MMLKNKVFIVCGVPASGKSWVCNQLKGDYKYIPHDGWGQRFEKSGDEYLEEYADAILGACKSSHKPILGDCPFAERKLRDLLRARRVEADFLFLKIDDSTLTDRYRERNKPIPKGHFSRLNSIPGRAAEWRAFYGSSTEALEHLKSLLSKSSPGCLQP